MLKNSEKTSSNFHYCKLLPVQAFIPVTFPLLIPCTCETYLQTLRRKRQCLKWKFQSVFNSLLQRLKRQLFRRSPFFNSHYLLITFFILHESRFSRLTSGLLHLLFQLNEF